MSPYLCLVFLFMPVFAVPDHHEEFVQEYERLVSVLSSEHLDTVKTEQHQVSGSPFPCTVYPPSPEVPTSVHALRPGDVKVVGAMGDSITAALGAGAATVIGMLTEYRGLSWSIGGDGTYEDQETLPNILKRYNPDLKGYSVGRGEKESNARFNVAVTGSLTSDLPDQARRLIARMREDETVDFENDWKVITVMTGGNDLCDVCIDYEAHDATNHVTQVTAALDILHAEVPRAFINLVETINVEIAKDLNDGFICTVLHIVCRCAAFPDGEGGEQLVIDTTEGYHTGVEQLIATGRYDTKDDFTVVVQPFLSETYLPRKANNDPDLSFFAPDCFHLSEKGQTAAANALWNNMIEPEGQKRVSWSPGEPIECPSEESPFFFTRKNSNLTQYTSAADDTSENFKEEFVAADDAAIYFKKKVKKADSSKERIVKEDFSKENVMEDDFPKEKFITKDKKNSIFKDISLTEDDEIDGSKAVGLDTENEQQSEYHSSNSTVVAIGATFLVLGLLGLVFTVTWTWQKRRKISDLDVKAKYYVSGPKKERKEEEEKERY